MSKRIREPSFNDCDNCRVLHKMLRRSKHDTKQCVNCCWVEDAELFSKCSWCKQLNLCETCAYATQCCNICRESESVSNFDSKSNSSDNGSSDSDSEAAEANPVENKIIIEVETKATEANIIQLVC